MAELVLTDISPRILQQLQARAASHRRTPDEEARVILSEVLQSQRPTQWAQVDEIYRRLTASGRTFSDSADSIREDRDFGDLTPGKTHRTANRAKPSA